MKRYTFHNGSKIEDIGFFECNSTNTSVASILHLRQTSGIPQTASCSYHMQCNEGISVPHTDFSDAGDAGLNIKRFAPPQKQHQNRT